MVSRLFLLYTVIELAVLVALTATIGFAWTLLLLVGTFIVGVTVAGSQARRQFARLRSRLTTPAGAATDGALVALGTVLVVVPGLVTTMVGLLLLLPPTRAAARPILTAMAVRGIGRRAPLVTVSNLGAERYSTGRGDVIDGEVIDVTDVQPPALPNE